MIQLSRPSNDELLDLFENAPVGLHFQGAKGAIKQANGALADILGVPCAQLIGKSFADFYVDAEAAAEHLARLQRGEDLNSAQVTLNSHDGVARHVLVSASVLRKDGAFVHARVFTREIPTLRRTMDALAQADARKAAILEASLDAIITMDSDGHLLDFNRAAESIFGYTRQEAINRRLSELIVPPRLRAAHEAGLRRYMECGIGPVIGRRVEITAMRADGREFPVELSIAVVQGTPPMFTATLRDITERLRTARELQEADRRKDEFIATLAHELRNPLSPIRTSAEILGQRNAGPEQIRMAVDVIRRQLRVMSRLLDDLLDVARVARGKLELRKESVEVGELIRTVVQTVQPMLDAKSQQLDLQAHNVGQLRLLADPLRIGQVLINLLTNASKYSGHGQVVTFRCTTSGQDIVFEVEDRGLGFRPAQAEQLFAMFTQLPEARQSAQGGLGVGLALARSLTHLHGGTLDAHSPGPGQGATFKVTLSLLAN